MGFERRHMAKNEFVSWISVSNWVPIITSAVMITIALGAVWTRLALIEQKQDQLASQYEQMIELFKNVERRYGLLSLDVKELQTLQDTR